MITERDITAHVIEHAAIQQRRLCGPLSIRETEFTAPHQIIPAHRHNFDHVTFVMLGTVRIRLFDPQDQELWRGELTAPDYLNIPAETGHEVLSLTERAMIRCVFPIRNHLGEIPDEITDAERRDHYYDNRDGQGDSPPIPRVTGSC